MIAETEKERMLLEMNRNLRRVLFHTVRQHGGTIRIKSHDLIKYAEAAESMRWRTDMQTGDIVLTAEYLLETPPAFTLGEGETPKRGSWLHEVVKTYRVLFGEVWRSRPRPLRRLPRSPKAPTLAEAEEQAREMLLRAGERLKLK